MIAARITLIKIITATHCVRNNGAGREYVTDDVQLFRHVNLPLNMTLKLVSLFKFNASTLEGVGEGVWFVKQPSSGLGYLTPGVVDLKVLNGG